MVKTSFNLNATAGVTGGSDRHFLLHVVIGQILPFNGTPHSTRPSYFINDGLVTWEGRLRGGDRGAKMPKHWMRVIMGEWCRSGIDVNVDANKKAVSVVLSHVT